MPYWVVEGYASGSYLGRPQRFSRVISGTETYYDSLVPNPIEIHLRTSTQLKWYGASPDTIPAEATQFDRWGIKTITRANLVLGGGGLVHSWNLNDGVEDVGDSDDEWRNRWPMESKYKLIERLKNFNGNFGTSYETNDDAQGTDPIVPPSSSNNLAFVSNYVRIGIATYWLPTLGFGSGPGVVSPANRGTISVYTYFNSFFRSGDAPVAGAFPPLGNTKLRGYKYGLYSAQPTKTSCVFRYNKYGQFRDMFEQRLFSKFSDDSLGETTTNGVVKVSFVTGSQTYANSIDYVSATNPDYDPTDTGFYDYEYRAGQPFYDG